MRQLLIIVFLTLVASVSACTGEHIPFVYKVDVLQGNIVTQEMVNQLEPGMNKARVQFIMGSPMLVDVFHQDRWDYIYLRRPGRGEPEQRRVTLYFEDDQLVRIAGDIKVAGSGPRARSVRRVSNVEVPQDQDEGFVKGIMDRVGIGDDDKEGEKKEATPKKKDEE